MKKYALLLISLLLLAPNSARAVFIEGLEDIPVMSGLHQIKKETFSFGNEESRFVEATLSVYPGKNKLSFAKVSKFYIETLPQMGWTFQGKRKNTLVFYRESEALEISSEKKDPLVVRITVKSRN